MVEALDGLGGLHDAGAGHITVLAGDVERLDGVSAMACA